MDVVYMRKEEASLIRTQAGTYEVMEVNRDGWNLEAFKERYSDILDKYDYIVGDWGYGQLRLRGFYTDANRKVPFEQRIAALDEYLHEFCNFGCPYFVLRKVKANVGNGDDQSGQDEAAFDVIIDIRQDIPREEGGSSPYVERKERRRYHPRQNKQDRQNNAGADRNGAGRNERGEKPKFQKDRPDKNGKDSNSRERRPNQLKPNRERDKVPTGPNTPKRES
ncbi:YutD family protein [Brevibacillus sp. BC25]|uniref:YutD family protein n=1 Tax=unclassified Brevibacillus TaxID=2684853 RepID=UPI00068DC3C2|nr:YutD family protein [Brevibacillus sp. BC25]